MLKLILGPARTGKTTSMMNEIKDLCKKGETGLYLLVPDQYSHMAERMFCAVCGNTASLHGDVLTFNSLASRILSETGHASCVTVNNAGRMLMMSRALQTALPDLSVFCRRTGNTSFIKELVETASELKNACVTSDDIRKASLSADPPLSEKLNDLALILEIYWSLFGASRLDPDDKLKIASEVLETSSFSSCVKIWVDGFADFSARQLEMLKKLIRCNADLTVSLSCDSLSSVSDVFDITRITAAQLISIAESCGTNVISQVFRRGGDLSDSFQVLERVLSGQKIKANKYDGSIAVVRASSITEECEFAASKVLEFVRSGYRWQDIAVVCGSWDQYRALGKSVFAKYGVPLYTNEKTNLLMLPPAALISAALNIIVSGWEYSNVFRYLKTGIPDISHDECDKLENYVLQWNISGSMWYSDDPWSMSLSGFQADGPDADKESLDEINDIRRRAAFPVIELQSALSDNKTVREKLTDVFRFIEDIRLSDKIETIAAEYERSGDYQTADTYRQAWDSIVDAMDQFCAVCGESVFDLKEFLSLWELVLTQYSIGTIPPAVDTVSFGDFERVRKRGTKCLLILGAADDAIPRITNSSGIFSDYERDLLIRTGLSLRLSTSTRIAVDMFDAYSTLMLPEERLVLSWSSSDLKGSEKRPSPVLTQICDCLGITPVYADPSEFRLAARIPCVEQALQNPNSAARFLCDYDTELSERLNKVVSSVDPYRGSLSADSAKALYGNDVSLSASRIEKFYSCRYQYFLKYGLKAKLRAKAELDPIQIGLFLHKVFENSIAEIKEMGGFKAVSDDICAEITRKHVREYVDSVLLAAVSRSGRIKYLVDRISSDAVQIMLEMAGEFRASDFNPLDFELSISESESLSSNDDSNLGKQLNTYGIVDRVDGWLHNGRLYLRVIDYKTGKKSFSFTDVWNGVGIQMLIYLFALERNGSKLFNHEIVPAGVLYVPARDAVISVSRGATDLDISKERSKQVRRSGLVLADDDVLNAMENGKDKRYLPVKLDKNGRCTGDYLISLEKLGKLSVHIRKLLDRVGNELLSGSITADPYCKSGKNDACKFCDYKQFCAFGDYLDDSIRRIKNLKSDVFWKMIDEETK